MIDKKRLETTPVQHIRNLIESIKDGQLNVTYYDVIEGPYTRTYNVACTPADADEFASKYEALVQALESIANVHAKLDSGVKAEDVLSPELVEVWNTYIREFDEEFDAGEFNLDEIYAMRESGAELSEEEHDALDRHYEWFEEQCLKRLPKKVYSPMHLVNRAQRYEYLLSCNAPKTVINEEGRCLAEEMLLYYTVK